MIAVVWQGATTASDIFLLVATILAGIAAVIAITRQAIESALIPAAICFIALGLLAV